MPSDVAGAAATVRAALTAADVGSALALSDAAGWNQTADDWSFFVGQGAIGERDGRTGHLVATASSLGYGRFGWVSMVLVAAEHRHRGLASGLVAASIAALRARGAVPVLDATPAGQPVYAALGFEAGFGFTRWERAGRSAVSEATERGPSADLGDLAGVADLDAAASGLDRRAWWADVARRPGSRATRDGAGGFALVRRGRRAVQLGPVVAGDEPAAIALVGRALASAGSAAVFVDVPHERAALGAHLAGAGFTRQRPFTRMALGAAPPHLGAGQFAFAGPEFG